MVMGCFLVPRMIVVMGPVLAGMLVGVAIRTACMAVGMTVIVTVGMAVHVLMGMAVALSAVMMGMVVGVLMLV